MIMAEELNQNQSEEIKIEELDDKDLEDASGGSIAPAEEASNSGCNCGCS